MYRLLAMLMIIAVLETTSYIEARSNKEKLRICPENEEFGLCLECEETCGEFYPMCSMGCEGVGCHCKPGFLRYGEICVRPSDCPQDSLSGLLGGGGVEGGYNGFDPDYAYGGYYPGGYGGFPLKSKKKA